MARTTITATQLASAVSRGFTPAQPGYVRCPRCSALVSVHRDHPGQVVAHLGTHAYLDRRAAHLAATL